MTLRTAPKLAGKLFTLPDREGHPRTLVADNEGILHVLERTGRTVDEDGNVLNVLELESVDGQPAEQFFVFEGDVPELYADRVDEEGRLPVRYVHGVGPEKRLVVVSGELEEDILNHTALSGLVRKEADDAQESGEDVQEAEAAQEEE